jgi:hypothetical protein
MDSHDNETYESPHEKVKEVEEEPIEEDNHVDEEEY